MKNINTSKKQNQKPARAPLSAAMDQNQSVVDFTPSPEEVARRAYFIYVNQGSLEGHEVQHWLVAEAELIAERSTRVHESHNHA